MWNTKTGKRLGGSFPHVDDASYIHLRLSPDGKTLLTGTGTDSTRLRDVETGKPRSRNLRHGQIHDMAFSLDGKLIVTAGVGGLRLWDVATGQLVGNPLRSSVWSPQHGFRKRRPGCPFSVRTAER